MHNHVTAASPTALVFLEARPRRILLEWTTFIWMVSERSVHRECYTFTLLLPLALGITDEVEKLGLKGSKKRKSKKLDEDYLVCPFLCVPIVS